MVDIGLRDLEGNTTVSIDWETSKATVQPASSTGLLSVASE
jgi:hypothetical protein